MARHALNTSRRHALLRAGLTITAAGAALGAGGAAAQAAPPPLVPATGADTGVEAAGSAVTGAVEQPLRSGIAPVTQLRLDPLAGTGTDPLDNTVGTQIADFKPLTTGVVTDPLTSGGTVKDLPVAGQAAGLLNG
ncbi:hypothetical protein ACF1BP_13310 [Streptomyces sp. NPDC014735]|uniref:hypothetical protein n=1 Tax=unclassified Streptomyces TaxID=2593676 RepID=UPI0036FDA6D7